MKSRLGGAHKGGKLPYPHTPHDGMTVWACLLIWTCVDICMFLRWLQHCLLQKTLAVAYMPLGLEQLSMQSAAVSKTTAPI